MNMKEIKIEGIIHYDSDTNNLVSMHGYSPDGVNEAIRAFLKRNEDKNPAHTLIEEIESGVVSLDLVAFLATQHIVWLLEESEKRAAMPPELQSLLDRMGGASHGHNCEECPSYDECSLPMKRER